MAQKRNDRKPLILAVRFSAMGDVAIAAGLLGGVCRANPDTRVLVLTRARWSALFDNLAPNLSAEGVELCDYTGPAGMLRLLNDVIARHGRPAAIVDLHSVLRSRLLCMFARFKGIRVYRIDKGRRDKKRLVAKGASSSAPLVTTADRYMAALSAAGLDKAAPAAANYAAASLPTGIMPRKGREIWIGVAPYAAHQSKSYPEDQTDRLLQLLHERYGSRLRLFLFGGGASEAERLAAKTSALSRMGASVTNMAAAKVGLPGEMALIARLDVMVAMDSGNMHLAALCGIPTVSVWGGTHPYAGFTPLPTAPSIQLGTDMPCRPCSVFGNRPCHRKDMPYACMRAVSPAQVADAVKQLTKE